MALVSRATIELKAVVLPRLMSARTTTIESEKRMALIGIGVPIVTICEKCQDGDEVEPGLMSTF